jgi:hypothetical protein
VNGEKIYTLLLCPFAEELLVGEGKFSVEIFKIGPLDARGTNLPWNFWPASPFQFAWKAAFLLCQVRAGGSRLALCQRD